MSVEPVNVARRRSTVGIKIAMAVLLNVWVSAPYYGVQYVRRFPVHVMPPSWVDRQLPFWPWMAWAYLSLFVLVVLPPLWLNDPRELLRYGAGIVLTGMVANTLFLLVPTSVLRPTVASHDWAYTLVTSADRPRNAIPSLHAALAVYSLMWFARVGRNRFIGSWVGLILLSTLLTRQHVLVDLIGGAALGILAFVLAVRLVPEEGAWT